MARIKNQFEIGRLLEISRNRNRPKKDDPFEGVAIDTGMTMYIDTRVGFKETRPMVSSLVGHMKGQYLILSTPRVDGMPVKYNESNTVNVYFIRERTVYSFKTKVMRYLGPPFYLSIFQIPDILEETPLRSSPRIQVGIPFDRAGGNPEKEFIINLSSTGSLLKLSTKMPVNSEFTISFFLPNGVSVNDIECWVKRLDMSHGRTLAGIEFNPQHEDFFAIERYMNFVLSAMEVDSNQLEDANSRQKETVQQKRSVG